MCFKTPKPPKVTPLPPAPQIDDAAVKAREAAELALLRSSGGTSGTVKSDLAPAAVQGAQKKITLGV